MESQNKYIRRRFKMRHGIVALLLLLFVLFQVCLPKIPSLFIHKDLRTIADSQKTTRNDTIIRKSCSR